MNFFETFPECSLPSTVSKNTIKTIGHHSRLRDVMGQSYLICAFAVSRNIVYKSNTREKTWQVECVEHIEQYKQFVESSPYLKRRGRKAFVESLFLQT